MGEKSTTIISLPQMVDLALNSPEVGIVNFTVLHSLLHVIVNQLDLGECNVEFRGSDSERLQNYISTAKPGPIITLTEYTIGPDGKGRKKRRRGSKRSSLDEKGKKDEKEKEVAVVKKEETSSIKEEGSSGSLHSQTIVVVEPASKETLGESPKFTIAMTKEQLGKLQKDMKDLKRQVQELTDLPGNTGLIEAVRGSKEGSNSPILDMFQILTLVKRQDASEVAINKMASMIEDLAKGQNSLVDSGLPPKEKKLSFKEQSRDLLVKSQELRRSLDETVGGTNQIQGIISELREIDRRLTEMENRPVAPERQSYAISNHSESFSNRKSRTSEMEGQDVPGASTEGGAEGDFNFDEVDLSQLSPQEAIALLQREIINMKDYNMQNQSGVQALKEIELLKDTLMSEDASKNLPPDVKFGQMDLRISELKEQLSTLDTVYNQQFSNVQEKLHNLDQEIASLWERINSGLPAGDGSGAVSNQSIQEVYNKLIQLQSDMEELSETANKLLQEREGRQTSLDVMIEQIELLKTVKADKEDLEDALADKADACQINRKVSHEQFDAAYDEITKSLESALDKLKRQEELWLQSLTDLQKEIGNKLDKMELTPLKDFINSKLKGIQDKVKKISAMKQEHEAAGTKSKLLRNVNCISCDADVVMKKQTDITLYPKPYALPATKSPAPYLAYELDLLRKQAKGLPNSKNLNVFESAMQVGKNKIQDKDHLCNRYCGGSHTITTPQQRVMRVGHFMEQWGPEIAPINEVLIKGTDGHLYKGRDDVALRQAAAERPPTPRVEPPAMTISEYHTGGSLNDIKSETKPDVGNAISSNMGINISISTTNKIDQKTSRGEMVKSSPSQDSSSKNNKEAGKEGKKSASNRSAEIKQN
ncbi:uncharacterized protein LOC126738269 [Anthonomus grandis grandis]|uniref:uncharacterized protein LOC126738269 n=1 Tax=Anthonomus grandis grandis TaxID=2921223 RepID=UPI0021669D4F|nr:uncharacterized protein LOC126738269 [Anthonomus grandis grandis]